MPRVEIKRQEVRNQILEIWQVEREVTTAAKEKKKRGGNIQQEQKSTIKSTQKNERLWLLLLLLIQEQWPLLGEGFAVLLGDIKRASKKVREKQALECGPRYSLRVSSRNPFNAP